MTAEVIEEFEASLDQDIRAWSQAISANLPKVEKKAVVSKAIGADILETAEKQELKIAKAFVDAVHVVKDKFSLRALEEAIAAGPSSVLTSLDLRNRFLAASRGKGADPQSLSFSEALRAAFNAGADYEITALGSVKVPVEKAARPKVGVELIFDYIAEEAVQFLRDYDFTLIREVTDSTLEAIQDVLVEGYQAGKTPATMARELKGIIGLTKSQAKAVRNYRSALESGDETQLINTLGRALRDGRFDRSILAEVEGRRTMSAATIDTMVERYEERFLQYRAMTIARTESLRAANAGQQEVWRQAINQDLLDEAITRKKWVVTRDGRTCAVCGPIPKMNPQGVPLGEQFVTPNGPYEYPPVHPSCRCTTVLKFN